MDEKKIFDEYGNYHFPTEKKQEGLNTIEEMAKDIGKTFTYAKKYYDDKYEPFELEVYPDEIARELYQKGYRKESDTAREILEKLKAKKQYEYVAYNDDEYCISKYELEKLFKERYGVDLGE